MATENSNEKIEHEDLTEFDTDILHRKGWHLVCMLTSKERAVEKANAIERKTGIRTKESDGDVTYEVWDKWFGI